MPNQITFPLKGEYIELVQLLKASGVCQTGGHAKMTIVDGCVLVDGEVETRKGRKIRSGQKVEIDDCQIDID